MRANRGMSALVLTAGVLITACGGGGDDQAGNGGGEDSGNTSGTASQAGGASGATGVVISVDGAEYQVDTSLGGSCSTQSNPDSGAELAAFGYDAATGKRVELSFQSQDAEFSPTGEDAYYGGLFIAQDEGGNWQVDSAEPWPWLDGDRSRVTGTVTMEDFDGNTVEVTFDVECP